MSEKTLTMFVVPASGDVPTEAEYLEKAKGIMNFTTELVYDIDFYKIHEHKVTTDWYGVIYTSEKFDDNLLEAIPVFLDCCPEEALIFYKRHTEEDGALVYSKAPRMFRKDIIIHYNLMPINPDVKFETVLDGWIEDV